MSFLIEFLQKRRVIFVIFVVIGGIRIINCESNSMYSLFKINGFTQKKFYFPFEDLLGRSTNQRQLIQYVDEDLFVNLRKIDETKFLLKFNLIQDNFHPTCLCNIDRYFLEEDSIASSLPVIVSINNETAEIQDIYASEADTMRSVACKFLSARLFGRELFNSINQPSELSGIPFGKCKENIEVDTSETNFYRLRVKKESCDGDFSEDFRIFLKWYDIKEITDDTEFIMEWYLDPESHDIVRSNYTITGIVVDQIDNSSVSLYTNHQIVLKESNQTIEEEIDETKLIKLYTLKEIYGFLLESKIKN